MVTLKCSTADTVRIDSLVPFQGELKKRTGKEVDELAGSIRGEGLLMPFAVWRRGDAGGTVNCLLDGHGRLAALTKMALEDPDIMEEEFPCVYIDAGTEEEARKALLQITSSYGKITKSGAISFTQSIPEYKAPAINKFVHKPAKVRRISKPETGVIVKIKVPMDKEEQVRKLLAEVSYIEVL